MFLDFALETPNFANVISFFPYFDDSSPKQKHGIKVVGLNKIWDEKYETKEARDTRLQAIKTGLSGSNLYKQV